MTPAARIQTSIELMDHIFTAPIPMDKVCGDYFRPRRYIGSKDRAAIAERVYHIMRHHARYSWWCESQGYDYSGRMAVLIDCLFRGDNLDALFNDERHGPPAFTGKEREFVKKLSEQELHHKAMPEHVRLEMPESYEAMFKESLGDYYEDICNALMDHAPLDVRVNLTKATREEVQEALARNGVESESTPYSPWGLRLKSKAQLSKHAAFSKGRIEIQDEGSQLIAYVCDVKTGERVLDYCAGAGGKTLALASVMGGKGRIVATDIDGKRLAKATPRFKRANLHDCIEIRGLDDSQNRKWLKRQKDVFDCVLIDAPCSGTGTWRRNPDARWRDFGPSLAELLPTQAEILEKTQAYVAPGGRLVYATCSLLRSENEDQIENFLKNHSNFTVQKIDEPIGNDAGHMRLYPHTHKTDGFFAAVLEKQK